MLLLPGSGKGVGVGRSMQRGQLDGVLVGEATGPMLALGLLKKVIMFLIVFTAAMAMIV